MTENKIMSADQLTQAEMDWRKGKGTSPLMGNIGGEKHLISLQAHGKIKREVIGTLPNGISKIGYTDMQGRIVTVEYRESRANAQTEKVQFRLDLEQSRKARAQYGDGNALNARAKELFLADMEEKSENPVEE